MPPAAFLGRMLLTFALAGAAAAPTAAAQTASPVGPEHYGINGQFLFRTPAQEWDRHLSAMAAGGLKVIRVDAEWGKVEPNAPVNGVRTYDWAYLDRIAEGLARNNLRWYPVIAYGTAWAASVVGPGGPWMSPPRDPADYAAFVEAFARRYGSQGTFWAARPDLPRLPVQSYEIWNEPNVEHFFPDQTTAPERYADLYVPAAAGVRSGDPAGQVLIGGLGSIGVGDFLTRMAQRRPELWSYVDAISYHPYGGHLGITFERIDLLRSVLASLGVGHLRIEITETGWASPPTPESMRADHMRQLAEDLPRSNCGITRVIPYTWVTDEIDPADPEDWFGIANRDGSLKPSGTAYSAAVLRMRGITPGAPTGTLERCSHPPEPAQPAEAAPSPTEPAPPAKGGRAKAPSGTNSKPKAQRRLMARVETGKVRKTSLPVVLRCNVRCRVALRVVARTHVLRARTVRLSGRRTLRIRLPRERLARLGTRRAGPRSLQLHARAVDGRGARVLLTRSVVVTRAASRRWARQD